MSKTAKQIGIERVQVMVDHAFEEVVKELKEENLERYIKEGWESRQNKVQVSISNRLRSTAGKAQWNTAKGIYKLKVHKEVPLQHKDRHNTLYDTIKHEVLHLVMLKGDRNSHFKNALKKLDIGKYHSLNFSTKEEYKYKTYCAECGKLTGKYKRKGKVVKRPELYHSRCCKASIRVEEL